MIERDGQALVKLAGREFTIRRSFIDDVSDQPQAEPIHALRRSLLVLHASGDNVVSIDNARHLFEAACTPIPSSRSTVLPTCSRGGPTRATPPV